MIIKQKHIPQVFKQGLENEYQKAGSFCDRIVEVVPMAIGIGCVGVTVAAYMLSKPILAAIGIGVGGGVLLYKRLSAPSINENHDTIHIMGEDHENEECLKLKNCLKGEARSGNIILAMESIFFNQAKDSVLGIEEPDLCRLSYAWSHYMCLVLYSLAQGGEGINKEKPKIKSKEITDLVQLHSSNPVDRFFQMLDVVNEANKSQTLHSNNKEILEVIESFGIFLIIDSLGKENDLETVDLNKIERLIAATKKFEKLVNIESEKPIFLRLHDNISQWINLLKDVFEVYLQDNYQKKQISLDMLHQGIDYIDQLQKYVEMDLEVNQDAISNVKENYKLKFLPFWEEIALHLRNPVFLKNIINIFEKNKYQKKPLYAIIGYAHAPFLYEELVKKGYKVALNDWAQVEYGKYYAEELKNHKRPYDEESVKELVRFLVQKLNHERLSFRAEALSSLNKLVENKLIDRNVLDTQKLVPFLIEGLNHESSDEIQNGILYLFIQMIVNKIIDKETLGIHELGKYLIAQLHNNATWNMQVWSLELLQTLALNQLISKEFAKSLELGKILIEKFTHDQKDVRASALLLFRSILEIKLIDNETLEHYQLEKIILEKLDDDHPDVQISALAVLRIMAKNRLIDQEVLDPYKLVKCICEKLDVATANGLSFLRELAESKSIDRKIADEFELGKRGLEKINDKPMSALFLLGKLIENKLIDKEFVDFYKLENLAIDKLSHNNLFVNINALWLLSLLVEPEVLFSLAPAIKCIDALHHSLVSAEDTFSKQDMEFLIGLFDKLMMHPEQKVQDQLKEMNSILKNRLLEGL